MRKPLLFLFALITLSVNAQQLENPSFENWEVEIGKSEPINWSSIQTGIPLALSGLAPKVIFEDANGHTGKCLKMENKSVFGIVANGVISNGRVFADLDPTKGYIFTDQTDSRWNTPLTAKPDSIVGWYKYEPTGADVGSVIAILHTGDGKAPDPDSINYVAHATFEFPNSNISSWTRFSAPFKYVDSIDPEYILLVLTSGDGTNAIAGSIGYLDDIELIYNTVSVPEVDLSKEIVTFGATQKIVIDSRLMQTNEPLNLKIYDIIGNELINETLIPGTRKEFSQINSGVYICQITVNGRAFISKIAVR